MSIKLKALGLGLLAACAMSAVVVMNASAETGGHFIAGEDHTVLLGEEEADNIFAYGGQEVTCNEAEFTGTTTEATQTQITITPHYDDCQANFITPAHVRMNGCDYLFTVNKTPASKHNTVHLTGCAKPIEVEITIPFASDCTLTIKEQTPAGGGVLYTNVATSPDYVTADITVSEIHVVRDGNSICGAATGETGALNGTATLKGFDTAGNQVGVTATGP
jgi:hypothetical protein